MDLGSTAPSAEMRRDALRNRDRLLEIARARIAAGDLELPMNAIAREAGVGVGTVYRHFPTRQSLLESVASDGFDDIISIANAAAGERDAATALQRLLGESLACLERRPGLARVLETTEFACLETVEMATGLAEAVTAIVDRARVAGLVRTGVTPNDIRRLVLGVYHARSLPGEEPAECDVYLAVFIAGLRG